MQFSVSVRMPVSIATPDDSHQKLLDLLDLYSKPRNFRNPRWKASQRRNKNVKQIISEASRKEASILATRCNSGMSTPRSQALKPRAGSVTPVSEDGIVTQSNMSKATQSLSNMVLEKNMHIAIASGPSVSYTNIESAPSLHPGHSESYCDITGLQAPYRDPKTRLRYHNKEIFDVVRSLPQGVVEKYLEARGAQVILK